MNNQIKARTVYWDSFPAYSDRLAILEFIKIGEYVEDLPFNIPVSSLRWRIPISGDTRSGVQNCGYFLLDVFYLEFIKIKCYKDSSRHIPWFVWQRVH